MLMLYGVHMTLIEATMTDINKITSLIINRSIKIHRDLGPGLLETVYEHILTSLLQQSGCHIQTQIPISFFYEGTTYTNSLRIDMIVDNLVLVELKSIEQLKPVHHKQVITYLKLMKMPVGLLINFGAYTLRDGLHRIVNNYVPPTQNHHTNDS